LATKEVVNPLDVVKWVRIDETVDSPGVNKMRTILNRLAVDDKYVALHKINGNWCVLFDINLLDIVVMIKCYSADRGKFQIEVKNDMVLILHQLIFGLMLNMVLWIFGRINCLL